MKKFIALVLVALIGYIAYYVWGQMQEFEVPYVNSQASPSLPADTDFVRKPVPLPADYQIIPVRPMVALSGASREDIFNLRKDAVAKSPFAQENYRPLDATFGQIVSGKPWYALTLCRGNDHAETNGLSEETRFINNPTALVAIVPSVMFFTEKDWCLKDNYNALMQKITYDGENREITVTYLDLPLEVKNRAPYQLNGLNARDLGYPYVYIDMERSTYKPSFREANNASVNVYKFRDFLHVGPSCDVPGGCNNGSPMQPEVSFDKDPKSSRMPREIYLKLWKEQPSSPQDEPDLVERIVILPKGMIITKGY